MCFPKEVNKVESYSDPNNDNPSPCVSNSRTIMKVALLGGAGGIGQPLALLLKTNELVSHLSLYDLVAVPGVAADLGHINTRAKVKLTSTHKHHPTHLSSGNCEFTLNPLLSIRVINPSGYWTLGRCERAVKRSTGGSAYWRRCCGHHCRNRT